MNQNNMEVGSTFMGILTSSPCNIVFEAAKPPVVLIHIRDK